jgi:hypothetical protein
VTVPGSTIVLMQRDQSWETSQVHHDRISYSITHHHESIVKFFGFRVFYLLSKHSIIWAVTPALLFYILFLKQNRQDLYNFAWPGLELMIFMSLPSKQLGLQAWATIPGSLYSLR